MSAPAGDAVRVRVPATSANLGPAFDCAGLALARHDVLEFSTAAGGLEVVMTGEGAHSLPADESHLVVRAFRAACDRLGWRPSGLRVVAENTIPQGRGMGSSAAAVVAGIVGAWALCPDVEDVDLDAALGLATEMEGHPDNVAPCLLGGATLSWTTPGGARAERLAVHPDVVPVVLVPPGTLSTHVARSLLPELVPHADAVFNASRAALLTHALTTAPALLLDATDDRLHQRQRAAAMPDTLAVLERLRAAGHAAVVSGAGPSVLVLARRLDGEVGEEPGAVRTVADLTPQGWAVLPLDVDAGGAAVLDRGVQVSSR
ncbi:homoserine kinase [Geodermatophilus sabuli]|uniref:Homoserine kinase n=1 Tax=Geodermatophilus sabuli TaxID=1564158 RepID=A0A285EGP0_9ACTN|nr:homoserine kinase [Geodermatophilus sabuli]MBB3085948.1 homoserine kinase [Geodermatophilus sabuli]SNX98289.1 homoserine kinase [Geodermatophilus sabuli]